MKKFLLLFALCVGFSITAMAQQIKASPFEGRWVWDGKGNDDPDFNELIFYGNVLLVTDENFYVYEGGEFTYNSRSIEFDDGYFNWKYRLAWNNLIITDEYDDTYTYTKASTDKGPLDGIWKITGGDDFDAEDDDEFIVFIGKIMAGSSGSSYEGMKVDFNGNRFYPSLDLIWQMVQDQMSEAEFRREMEVLVQQSTMIYALRGQSLTISYQGEDIILSKIY